MALSKCIIIYILFFLITTPLIAGVNTKSAPESSNNKANSPHGFFYFKDSSTGKYGFINGKGKVVIPAKFIHTVTWFDSATGVWSNGVFSDGMAPVKKNKYSGWTYINPSGKPVIKASFKRATPFINGIATADIPRKDRKSKRYFVILTKTNNGIQISQRIQGWNDFYHNGIVTFFRGIGGGKSGAVNIRGKVVLRPIYHWLQGFSEGLSVVFKKIKGEWKVGYINKASHMVLPYKYKSGGPFRGGIAPVIIKNLHVYINHNGDILFNGETFFNASSFQEGRAQVTHKKNGKWGYINAKGEVVIPFKFNKEKSFNQGLAPVAIIKEDKEKWGYINKAGNWIIKPKFDNAGHFIRGLARVHLGNTYGLIDQHGNWIWKATKKSKKNSNDNSSKKEK